MLVSGGVHQGKSRWHSYHILVYISPVKNLPFGDGAPCTLTMGFHTEIQALKFVRPLFPMIFQTSISENMERREHIHIATVDGSEIRQLAGSSKTLQIVSRI